MEDIMWVYMWVATMVIVYKDLLTLQKDRMDGINVK